VVLGLAVLAVVGVLAGPARAATTEFKYTGAEQTFTVPAGVTSIGVTAIGAPGGDTSGLGGRGAIVTGALTVAPGQTLFVEVGATAGEAPGFNGGGGYNGGDATDVRTVSRQAAGTLQSRLIVAAGGGSGGDVGALGRDADDEYAGSTCAAGSATQAAGGKGGGGGDGTLGKGGEGYAGGGGGLYGGGGGGYDGCGLSSGGGGGSSLVPPGGTKGLAERTTAPLVRFTYPDPLVAEALGPGDRKPPAIERLAISPTAFTAANSGPALVSAVGGLVFYRLSEAASVAFSVERAAKGHRKGKRCVAKGKGKPCTRYVKVRGGFTHSGAVGLNEFRFMGRLGGRALAVGRHRLVAVATDAAGNRSKPATVGFRVK
jgi:hypothetical protein